MQRGMDQYVFYYLSIIKKNVRRLRGDITQAEFAKKVGVSRTTIQRIESGKNFHIDSLFKIAFILNIYPYEFCMTEDEKKHVRIDANFFQEVIKKMIVDEVSAKWKKD